MKERRRKVTALYRESLICNCTYRSEDNVELSLERHFLIDVSEVFRTYRRHSGLKAPGSFNKSEERDLPSICAEPRLPGG